MDIQETIKNKKHVFLFQTKSGVVAVGTDNVEEIAHESWFADFLNVPVQTALRQEERVVVPVQKQEQRTIVEESRAPIEKRQISYLDFTPETITEQVWKQFSLQQQHEWRQKYYPGS